MNTIAQTLAALVLLLPVASREEMPRKPSPEQIEKFRKMSPEERARLKERWKRFKALPAEDREKILQNVERLKGMKPEALHGLMKRFKELPEDRRFTFHRMLKKADIPSHMLPRLIQWIQRNYPDDGLKQFMALPESEQREAFEQVVGRFKKETIRSLVQRKIVPQLFADVMKGRPLSDQWRMAMDCLREHRERMRKEGKPSEDDTTRPPKERGRADD